MSKTYTIDVTISRHKVPGVFPNGHPLYPWQATAKFAGKRSPRCETIAKSGHEAASAAVDGLIEATFSEKDYKEET